MISKKHFLSGGGLIAMILILALAGCSEDGADGLNGLDGADGATGPAGTATCLECHSTDAQIAIGLQYRGSGHALGEFVGYAGGRASCARCHSGTGFAEYAETGDVAGDFTAPDPIGCRHCHNVHDTFGGDDYALRITGAVAWIWDEDDGATSVDFGDNSNLCANCHQSRRGEPNLTDPGDTFIITSTHWGPHHGAQANVLAGLGFAEIAGSTTYPTANLHTNAGATCISCHMAAYAEETGGHTWWPSQTACNDCHGVVEEDYDHNGFKGDIETLLDTLRDRLLALGVIEEDHDEEGVYHPFLDTEDLDDLDGDGKTVGDFIAVVTMDEAQAFFNWIGLLEDRSNGAHNPRYVEALLENSIEVLQ